jgi:hypothetical protein
MDVLIARLKPVVDAIDRLTAAVVESNRLEALRLQQIDGLTTHITQAKKEDLLDTHVSYNDPEWTEALSMLEEAKGRALDEDELNQAWSAWQETEKEDKQAR